MSLQHELAVHFEKQRLQKSNLAMAKIGHEELESCDNMTPGSHSTVLYLGQAPEGEGGGSRFGPAATTMPHPRPRVLQHLRRTHGRRSAEGRGDETGLSHSPGSPLPFSHPKSPCYSTVVSL